ncbi:hypothetical protein ACFYNU_26215 [Streptomyces sp. NPDC006643]|uniref:hypothetical protein n=1 Tax=Streptomyces sp. NPDC006643 TaxID=3364756 RepID=UPI00367779F8
MKLNRFPALGGYGIGWSANRRILIVALVITALLAVAATVAWFTGRTDQHNNSSTPGTTSDSSAEIPTPKPSTTTGGGSVSAPAQIAEPVAYAKAAALMLWSYDTRTTSRDQQLAGMRAWMTEETQYADWASVAGQVPDPLLWSRMADQDQHATATVTEGHFPSAFKQALADDPSAITDAYIYVVTVNGTQQIGWAKDGAGAEERAVTLAVQCRPDHDCTLAALAPAVTQ